MIVAVLTVSVVALWTGPTLAIGGREQIQAVPDTQGIPDQANQLLQGVIAPMDTIGKVRNARSPASSSQNFKGKPTSCFHRGKDIHGECLQLSECYPFFRFPEAEAWRFGIYDSCNDLREGVLEYGVCCVKEDGDTNNIHPGLPQAYRQISLDDDTPGLLDRSHVQYRPSRPTQNMTRGPTIRGDAWNKETSYPMFPAHPTHPPLPTHPPSLTDQPWWVPQGGSGRPTTPKYTPPTTKRPPVVIWTKPTTTTTTTRRTTQTIAAPTSTPIFGDMDPCRTGSFYLIDDDKAQNVWDASYNTSRRVVGGFPSRPHSHPWLATLFNGQKQFCGGSLIDKTHILTAAHCIAHMSSVDVSRLRVRLGAHNIGTNTETTTQEFRVTKVVRHKDYDAQKLYNDIAMLTLDSPAEFNRFVRPICLASGGSWVNEVVTVAGWGSLYEGGPQPPALQEVRLNVWALDRCRAYYGSAAPGGIVSSYICAGDGGKDSCMGDSGGPLVTKSNGVTKQIGIVSWGIGCGKGNYPGVYSRLPTFYPWVNRVKAIYR